MMITMKLGIVSVMEEVDMEIGERGTTDHWTHYVNLVKKLFEEEIQSEDIRVSDVERQQRLERELDEAFLLQYQTDLVRYEALKNDETTESVLKSCQRFMREEEMLSFESLKAAIDRRKHLILENAPDTSPASGDIDASPMMKVRTIFFAQLTCHSNLESPVTGRVVWLFLLRRRGGSAIFTLSSDFYEILSSCPRPSLRQLTTPLLVRVHSAQCARYISAHTCEFLHSFACPQQQKDRPNV